MPCAHRHDQLRQWDTERMGNAVQGGDFGSHPSGLDFDDRLPMHPGGFCEPVYRHGPLAAESGNLDAEGA